MLNRLKLILVGIPTIIALVRLLAACVTGEPAGTELARFQSDIDAYFRDRRLIGWNYAIEGQSASAEKNTASLQRTESAECIPREVRMLVLARLPASLTDEQVVECIDFIKATGTSRLGSIDLTIRVYMVLEFDIIQRQSNPHDLNADNNEIEAELLKYQKQVYYDYAGRSDLSDGINWAYRYTISILRISPEDRATITAIDNWFLTSKVVGRYELLKIR